MKKTLFFLFFLPFFLLAQPNQQWYKDNDRGLHFEGSYTLKVSNPSVNLVSLTGNLPIYEFGENQKLNVHFFSPDSLNYQLHAEELRISQFYWMEDKNKKASQGWNIFKNWNVDYLLKRFSIDPRNLGILIHIGEQGYRYYLPALVEIEEKSLEQYIYIAQIRLGRPIRGGHFSLYEGQGRSKSRQVKIQEISRKSSGIVFPIVIPFNELGEEEGWFTVELNLIEQMTNDPFTYSFSFYHHLEK